MAPYVLMVYRTNTLLFWHVVLGEMHQKARLVHQNEAEMALAFNQFERFDNLAKS
jgi:hypothetical protein